MKKRFYIMLLAAAAFALPACNTETGTVHETKEGYGAGQREPGDTGADGTTRDNATSTDTGSAEMDTSGTSATMKTKKGVGTTQTRGTTNTSQSETTKNVEVKKQ